METFFPQLLNHLVVLVLVVVVVVVVKVGGLVRLGARQSVGVDARRRKCHHVTVAFTNLQRQSFKSW